MAPHQGRWRRGTDIPTIDPMLHVPPSSDAAAPTTEVAPEHAERTAPAGRRLIGRARRRLSRLSLARRFIVANILVFVVAGIAVGAWLSGQVEHGILQRTAAVTALFVNSFIEPRLTGMAASEAPVVDRAELDALMQDPAFTSEVAALIVWAPDGTMLYGPDEALVGQRFRFDDLEATLRDEIMFGISDLSQPKTAALAERFDRLFEVYVPLREPESGAVIGVAELYKVPDEIDREVADARLASWAIVAVVTLLSTAVLFLIVKRGSDTIEQQEAALARQVDDLTGLLAENEALNERVRNAADRATTVNERALRRISSDLHDGPGQSISLALLRLDEIRAGIDVDSTQAQEMEEVERALRDAMRDMRAIAAGLRLPELASMSTRQAVQRAVDDHTRRSGTAVDLDVGPISEPVPLSVRVSMYRALQELLSNATRHGGGAAVRATVESVGEKLCLEVSDAGPGFDPAVLVHTEGLGLAGMHEQAELLGGSFEARSAPGAGATVRVCWRLEPTDPEPEAVPA